MSYEMEKIKESREETNLIKESRGLGLLKIGSHVSMSGKHMLLAASKEAVSYGANTFMIYTGAPKTRAAKKLKT